MISLKTSKSQGLPRVKTQVNSTLGHINVTLVAKSYATASRISCQSQCQSDPQCQSVTFYEPNSDKPNTCVLNYGPIKRKESFPGLMGLASSPKFC